MKLRLYGSYYNAPSSLISRKKLFNNTKNNCPVKTLGSKEKTGTKIKREKEKKSSCAAVKKRPYLFIHTKHVRPCLIES